MKPKHTLPIAIAILLCVVSHDPLSAQTLKIVSLKPPTYPPMALAARVSGEVDLKITLIEDGTPGDIQIVSGPAMLRQTTMDSARGSRFEIEKNSQSESPYLLRYTYLLKPLDCGQALDNSYPLVRHDSDTVTVTGEVVPLCDPGGEIRVRSLKCLYLWRCGIK